jgi:hypothetical protein
MAAVLRALRGRRRRQAKRMAAGMIAVMRIPVAATEY